MLVEACPWKTPDVLAAEDEACLENGFFTASAAQAPCKNHQTGKNKGVTWAFLAILCPILFVYRKNYEKSAINERDDLFNVTPCHSTPLHQSEVANVRVKNFVLACDTVFLVHGRGQKWDPFFCGRQKGDGLIFSVITTGDGLKTNVKWCPT